MLGYDWVTHRLLRLAYIMGHHYIYTDSTVGITHQSSTATCYKLYIFSRHCASFSMPEIKFNIVNHMSSDQQIILALLDWINKDSSHKVFWLEGQYSFHSLVNILRKINYSYLAKASKSLANVSENSEMLGYLLFQTAHVL